jgi:hypothetical protein
MQVFELASYTSNSLLLGSRKPVMISYTSGITVRFTCDESCLALLRPRLLLHMSCTYHSLHCFSDVCTVLLSVTCEDHKTPTDTKLF